LIYAQGENARDEKYIFELSINVEICCIYEYKSRKAIGKYAYEYKL